MSDAARVDSELVRRGLARSREHAVTLVADGRVRADGRVLSKPAQRVGPTTALDVETDPDDPGFASRAGHKLAGALASFGPGGLRVHGRRCLDVGSSTGGFTDVLLRTGADHVVCLDVGHDQLVPRLRDDPRTLVLEGHNVRDLTAQQVGVPVDVAVADVSFISLVIVLPAVAGVLAPGADLVLMVKPQFEVGRDRLGAGGVVHDPLLRRDAVRQVAAAADGLGWGMHGIAPSVLPGPAGNVEYFLWLRRGPATVRADAVDRAVAGHTVTGHVVADPADGEKVAW